MARYKPEQDQHQPNTSDVGRPTMPGGSSGMDDGPQDQGAPIEATRARAEVNIPPAKRYRIVGAPSAPGRPPQIMYKNCRTNLQIGKVISENQYDLQVLRDQGVILEAIDEPKPVDAKTDEAKAV